jgi:RimJ/RimL family protein N-acetyltransferase
VRVDHAFEPIVTERLRLRRSRPEDAEAISAYRSLPEVHRQQGWERVDPQSVRRDIEEMSGRDPGEPGGWVQFSVERLDDGALVGDVGISPADGEPGVVKIGYTIDPAHHRRGYATEAVGALVRYLFDVLDAEIVRAYASADNEASIGVATKVGMRLVDRTRHQAEDGDWFSVRYERRRDG